MRWGMALALTVAVGCGRLGYDGVGGQDPNAPDAGDAGSVSLVVFDSGQPVAGLDVLFHDPAGALTTQTTTDIDGTAAAEVVPGSSVTLVWVGTGVSAGEFFLDTLFDIQPGDALRFSEPTDLDAPNGNMAVSMPGTFPSAVTYILGNGCDEGEVDPNGIENVTVPLECSRTGSTAVIAGALDAGGDLIAYSAVGDIVLPAAGAAQVAMPNWQTAFLSMGFDVSGLPAGSAAVEVKVDFVVSGQTLFGDSDGSMSLAEPVGLGVGRPMGLGGQVAYLPCVFFEGEGASGKFIQETLAETDLTVPVDLSDSPPEIANTIFSRRANGGATVTYQTAAPMTSTDVGVGILRWLTANQAVRWSFSFPPSTTEITTPQLPEQFASLRFDGSETMDLPMVVYFEPDFIDSYAQFRSEWWGRLRETFFLPENFVIRFSEGAGGFSFSLPDPAG